MYGMRIIFEKKIEKIAILFAYLSLIVSNLNLKISELL